MKKEIITERTLEIIEEMKKIPVSTIYNVGEFQEELSKLGYTSYLDETTDYLIVEKDN